MAHESLPDLEDSRSKSLHARFSPVSYDKLHQLADETGESMNAILNILCANATAASVIRGIPTYQQAKARYHQQLRRCRKSA